MYMPLGWMAIVSMRAFVTSEAEADRCTRYEVLTSDSQMEMLHRYLGQYEQCLIAS